MNKALTIDIRARSKNEAQRMAQRHAEDAIDYASRCGQLLIEKKKIIPHGQWILWVEARCEFSERQSRRYMVAAKRTSTSDLTHEEKLCFGRDIWGNKPKKPPVSFPDPADFPDDKYNLIYADPPWRYEFSETDCRKIENQHPTMALDDIRALAISDIAADDCILFLWATSPKLTEAISVIEAWGNQVAA